MTYYLKSEKGKFIVDDYRVPFHFHDRHIAERFLLEAKENLFLFERPEEKIEIIEVIE